MAELVCTKVVYVAALFCGILVWLFDSVELWKHCALLRCFFVIMQVRSVPLLVRSAKKSQTPAHYDPLAA